MAVQSSMLNESTNLELKPCELLALSDGWGRAALGKALGWLAERESLTADKARAVGRQILSKNAAALYHLPPLI